MGETQSAGGVIWTRQSGEDEAAWAAFQAFRDQRPPRKLLRPGVPTADASRWAQEHAWFERAAAYDRHLDAIRLAERDAFLAQDEREVAAEHRRILSDGRELVEREMAKLLKLSQSSDIESLRPGDLGKLLDLVVKYDRLLRDQPTENRKDTVDLSGLGIEELKQLAELRKKIR